MKFLKVEYCNVCEKGYCSLSAFGLLFKVCAIASWTILTNSQAFFEFLAKRIVQLLGQTNACPINANMIIVFQNSKNV